MRERRRAGTGTIRGLAGGLGLLGLAGCGDGGAVLVGAAIALGDTELEGSPVNTPPLRNLGAEAVEVQRTALRTTPGGCEIEVTYRNLTDRPLSIGFTYVALDASGRELGSLSTPVQLTPPGETRTIASGTTTAGPSGLACSRIASTRLTSVGAFTF